MNDQPNERPTPETDRIARAACDDKGMLCRPQLLWDALERLERERDDAREELADWALIAEAVHSDRRNERHCVCATVYRKERDDALADAVRWQSIAEGRGRVDEADDEFARRLERERDEALDQEKIHYDNCVSLEQQRDEAREALRQTHKDYGCELRDPNGTIWDHAAKLQEQLAAAKQELSDLSHAMGQLLSSERHLSASLLNLIADIRAAVGDPTGKLMQDELVEHCRALAARGKEQG